MNSRSIFAIPATVIMALYAVAAVVSIIRERRAYRLFAKETGLSKREWKSLSSQQQEKWHESARFEREAGAFVDDYRRNRK